MGEEEKVQLKEVYPVHERVRKIAYIKSREEYEKLYAEFLADPPGWWAKQADEYLTFFKKWDKVEDFNFDIRKGPIYVKYFEGAKLNVSYNCLDRQLEKRGDKVAIQWVGNEPGEERAITYRELLPRSLQVRQCTEITRDQEGRPRLHLHADGPRGRYRHAGLLPHRRHPYRRFRRFQLRRAVRPDPGFEGEDPRRLRRDLPRRQGGAAEEGRRHGPEGLPLHREGDRGEAGRRQGQTGLDPGPRPLVARGDGEGRRQVRTRMDGCRGSPLHPLHLRLHRDSPRAPSTPRPVICFLRPTRTSSPSMFTKTTSGGAPPTSAG